MCVVRTEVVEGVLTLDNETGVDRDDGSGGDGRRKATARALTVDDEYGTSLAQGRPAVSHHAHGGESVVAMIARECVAIRSGSEPGDRRIGGGTDDQILAAIVGDIAGSESATKLIIESTCGVCVRACVCVSIGTHTAACTDQQTYQRPGNRWCRRVRCR